jgi:NAD(P)-dependent dehydrogenase (short-subunit alcohol dehydrogenase family)
VNAVCPGYTDTVIVRDAVATIAARTGRSQDTARAGFLNPQGRLIQPDEVAAAVAYLVSDAAAPVTGQALTIAGGEL